jgi:DNA polymerase-3 subunit delta
MTDHPPKIYFLHGDDEFAMAEFIQSLKNKLGDESSVELNYFAFDAPTLDWPAFEAAACSIPFLAHRRIIVLDHVEHFIKDQEKCDRLIALFDQTPESTALLLLERKSSASTKQSKETSVLKRWAEKHPGLCYIRSCETPGGSGFVSWLQGRAAVSGGSIENDASELLADWTQEDPRLASQELAKLLDFVDYQRPIQIADVEQSTPYRGQSNIFALVDAIGLRQGKEAIAKLHQVLQEDDASYAFAMIIRQFRLILRARELIDSGKTPDRSIHRSEFVVRKVAAQARNFSLPDLERIYHELLEIDLESKNGGMELDVALDRLVSVITT